MQFWEHKIGLHVGILELQSFEKANIHIIDQKGVTKGWNILQKHMLMHCTMLGDPLLSAKCHKTVEMIEMVLGCCLECRVAEHYAIHMEREGEDSPSVGN